MEAAIKGAADWVCRFDLMDDSTSSVSTGDYSLPHDIFLTALRADGYAISRLTKCCVLIELTCPLEENITQWHATKTDKYAELRIEAELKGWKVFFLVVEVGARGWIPPSTTGQLRAMGLAPSRVRALGKKLSDIAQKSSYVIWINRFNKNFNIARIRE